MNLKIFKENIAEIVRQQIESISRELYMQVSRVMANRGTKKAEAFISEIQEIIEKYKIPRIISENYFERDPLAAAKGLIGSRIFTDDVEAIITETGAYKGFNSRRVGGLELGPGKLFFPKYRYSKHLIINTEKEGVPSAVSIRGLRADEKDIPVFGVVDFFGLDKSLEGKLFYEAGLKIELQPAESTFLSYNDAEKRDVSMPTNALGYFYLKK